MVLIMIKPFNCYISSYDEIYEEEDNVRCHICFFGKLIKLPFEIIKPIKTENLYREYIPRSYGFTYMPEEGCFIIYRGDKTLFLTLPWKDWNYHDKTFFNIDNTKAITEKEVHSLWKDNYLSYVNSSFFDESNETELVFVNVKNLIPHQKFKCFDYDGTEIIAGVYKVCREWQLRNKILRMFSKPLKRYTLEIKFNRETGVEKGSWKGGVTGAGIETTLDESWEDAFKRYCLENKMLYEGLIDG